VFFAIILVILTTKLLETTKVVQKFKNFKDIVAENIYTAKTSIKNVF
jgi:hypothetical protein